MEERTISQYDRQLSGLHGLPEVASTKPSTLRAVSPFGLGTNVFIVQTFRQKEVGDTIFLEHGSEAGYVRIVIPPAVADAIARQRDQLTFKVRSRAGKQNAENRAALGIKPGFMKGKGKK